MKAVLLAGGKGTRLGPYTAVFPKPLMPLGNHPILEVIICQLRSHGFTEIWLAVGHLSHLLRAYFGDGSQFGVSIYYSLEEQPLGTAGPLTLIPGLDEPFLVMNGDVLTDHDYGRLYRHHLGQGTAVTVGMYSKEVKIDLGVLVVNSSSDVANYVEKPTFNYPVSMGIYTPLGGRLRF
jgi:NDP-sugar pyrophosphorylase family protein